MHPQPPQPIPTAYLDQFPAPTSVRALAVLLWITIALSFTVLTINMVTAPMYGVDPGYAFGYSFFHTVIGLLLLVVAVPVTRGRPWARHMTNVLLILQIIFQGMMLLGGNNLLWALFLLPSAIAGMVLLHRPTAKRFFAMYHQAANQEYMQQYAAQQGGQGYPPPAGGADTYPQEPYGYQPSPQQPPQGGSYGQQPYPQQPPQGGSWGQYPHQQ